MITSQLNLQLSQIEKKMKTLHSIIDLATQLDDSSIIASAHSAMSTYCRMRDEIEGELLITNKNK
jgi:hypothetical protein